MSITYKSLSAWTINAHGEDLRWLGIMGVTELGSGAGLQARMVLFTTVLKKLSLVEEVPRRFVSNDDTVGTWKRINVWLANGDTEYHEWQQI